MLGSQNGILQLHKAGIEYYFKLTAGHLGCNYACETNFFLLLSLLCFVCTQYPTILYATTLWK